MGVVLVGGGARSGKSQFALDYAGARFQRRAFVATAQGLDAEMESRIRKHQADRGPQWTTIEEPLDIVAATARKSSQFDAIVVDCLTLWLSNMVHDRSRDAAKEIKKLKLHLSRWEGPSLILVTNEVGCGVVPENALAREYRDLAGEMNQTVARLADEVYWMVFGVAMTVKG